MPLDLADMPGIDRLGGAINERWGKLDILVANAGVLGIISPIGHVEAKTFEKVMTINVTSTWRLIRSVDPLLRLSDAGRAIVVSSNAAHSARAFWGPYAASKAAVETLTRSWANETVNMTLRVNAFDPGATRTAMRAQAVPGEDPKTLPHPSDIAGKMRSARQPCSHRNGPHLSRPNTTASSHTGSRNNSRSIHRCRIARAVDGACARALRVRLSTMRTTEEEGMKRILLLVGVPAGGRHRRRSSQDMTMSFFVTSVGTGKGANLGGLEGADAHCASLAEAAGVTGKTWRAYLSTSDTDARDRIGAGPWVNAKGEKIADDVASLHGDANGITKQTGARRKGRIGQRARRPAEPPRHADRNHAGRHQGRTDLRRLDDGRHGRRGDGRPSRPYGPRRFAAGKIVELLSSDTWRLQSGGAEGHGRRRPVLLFRHGLKPGS